MLDNKALRGLVPLVAMLVFCAAALAFRPLLPIDETRYMSVAWEMHLKQGWFDPLTMNFQPYSHKPPLLFWLINLSWAVFGVSRWAALVPVGLVSAGVIYLTGILARQLYPDTFARPERVWAVTIASVPVLVYGTLMMFDMLVALIVLGCLITLHKYRHDRRPRFVWLLGLLLGIGVLAKGPVAYLYVGFPLLCAPVWSREFDNLRGWYLSCLSAVLISLLPILLWLIPVLRESSSGFAFWLLWNQTAGRITGNFQAAHVRPIWFYLQLLPVMLLPWIFFPQLWRNFSTTLRTTWNDPALGEGTRFLAVWIVPVFFAFTFISGKQPHYLLPLVPGAAIFVTLCLGRLSTRTLVITALAMGALIIVGQGAAKHLLLHRYKMEPLAEFIHEHHDRPWAYVSNYNAEFGFIGRLEIPLEDVPANQLKGWLQEHPGGLAIIRYRDKKETLGCKDLLDIPYRSGRMGAFDCSEAFGN
ncbi:ArnT family glycosyltransferase [Radicibacter daui]|uniref:ArnT family glycosyltransferase n=1 Tax=Radicibacter daui TaxID=3064829 RepID=UPI004046F72D